MSYRKFRPFPRQIPGEKGGEILIATDGVRFEVIYPTESAPGTYTQWVVPTWAKLYWFLKDDPRGRADWSGTQRTDFTKPNKLGKSDT